MAKATGVASATRGSSVCAFELLGPLRVMRAGASLRLGGRQQKAVLARLLLEPNRLVTTDRLVRALWGERDPAGAVTSIQTYISHLRDALEPDRSGGKAPSVVVTEQNGYRLQIEESSVDAWLFEREVAAAGSQVDAGQYVEGSARFAAALSLWRGRVLEDLSDLEFVRPAAARLDALRLDAIEGRIDAELALGHHRAVADELSSVLVEHPFRERLHTQLMLAHYRSGRQADALDVYERLRRTLADELGIDPNRAAQSLHLSIVRQDPLLDWRRELVPVAAPAALRPPVAHEPAASPTSPRVKLRRPRSNAHNPRLIAGAVVAVAAVLAAGVVLQGPLGILSPPGVRSVPANSVALLRGDGGIGPVVAVGQSPSALVAAGGSLWVTNGGSDTVSRVDPAHGRVEQTVRVGSTPEGIAATPGSVWVANSGDGTVSRVSTATSTVVDTIQVGNLPTALASDRDGVWVANAGDDTIQRIDAATDRAEPPIAVGGQPAGLAVSADTVWVTNREDGTLSPVDRGTGTVRSPIAVGSGPGGVSVAAEAVWVANSSELSVSRVDPASGRQMDVIAVGDGPHSLTYSGRTLWVSNEYDGTLTQIDPKTAGIVKTVRLGSSPRGLAATGSGIWVAANSPVGAAHRGGTLTVEGAPVPGFDIIDPATSWLPEAFAIAYDGLVALRRTGGAAGGTLVPDLATSLPRPTDGGRSYTFTIRSGVHYSDGQVVGPEDFRRGLLRALAAHSDYFYGIVGARECAEHHIGCDLTDGVVVDAAGSRVTFRLVAADPDFLYKLSVRLFAIPPSVAPGELSLPVPGTGPYVISGFSDSTRAEQLTLIRNPYFHQWSHAAKPDGYVDVIRWRRVRESATRIDDVLGGRADLSDPSLASFTSEERLTLGREHNESVHSAPLMATLYFWLNTRIPPFDDVRVRRALNYAIDRNRLVELLGGSSTFTVSCQVLPPNYPGYRRYCPYTVRPSTDGSYHGPDPQTAQRLADGSPRRGTRVVLWSDEESLPAFRYLARVLEGLGYPTTVNVDAEHQADAKTQLDIAFWAVDFPSLSNFWEPLLSCASSRIGVQGQNRGGYCDRSIDALAREAFAAQGTDPSRARRLWAQVDRALTLGAPWVPGPAVRSYALTSRRVGNYQVNPVLGPLIDQMWVR